MKKILIIIMSVILVFIMNITCFAQVVNFQASYKENSLLASGDRDEVQKLIEERKVNELILQLKGELKTLDGVGGPDELTYGSSYKIFYIDDKELVEALSSNKKLSDIISDTHYIWETPIALKNKPNTAVGSFTVEKYKNAWEICEIGGSIPPHEIIFSSHKDQIEKVFEQNGITSINSYFHLRVPSIYKDYLVINSNSSEVYIELDDFKESKPEKTIMNADEIKQDVLERVKAIYGESDQEESLAPVEKAEVEPAPVNQMNSLNIIVLSAAAISIVGIIIYVKRRARLKEIPADQGS